MTINGNTGRLIAIGGRLSSAIGCRDNRVAYGGLIINGGVISAHGNSSYTSGIGAVGADDSHGSFCGDITINGGTINAAASDGIGIGAGGPNSCGAITINGGTITSHAVRSIAIGGNCSKVVINGGNINASTTTSVGIGSSGVVYIEGGTIVASASDWEGVGISGDKGVLIRSGITSLTASKGPYGANAINGATVYISANLNDVTEGNTRTLTPKASLDPEADIAQDGEGYYLVGSVQNWKEFVVLSQMEASPKGKLVADINLGDEQAKIATFEGGIFDGQGHTITINLSTTTQYVGLFCDIIDATIKNLHVTGSINTTNRFVGGMVGRVYYGTSTIQNCWSSVNVTTTYSGDGVQGGMVGCVNGTLNISDCLYDGALNGSSAYTWGGFVGWLYGSTNISNCLFASDEMNVGASYTATHVAGGGTITNCYYKNVMGSAQGTEATTAELADGTTAYKLQNNRGDMVWGQRIGTDAMPVLTNDENYRVYRSKTGGYTNNPEEAYEGIQQDGEGNYLLGSLRDWQEFAEIVNSGTNAAANAKMTADIDLGDDQTHIGSVTEGAKPFYEGVFDGQGHTLTVNYVGGSNQIVAPFTHTSNATIKNLHVAGSIQSSYAYIGVVGMAGSGSLISKVWMSATMNTTQGGWVQSAAIAGYCDGSIQDCLFTGTYTSNGGGYMGGFYGYTNASPTITNCLSTGTFSQGNWQGNGVHTNCYLKQYPTDLTQGCSWATDETLTNGTIATSLQNGRGEEVWVQDPITNQPMLALFANLVTLTDGDDLSALLTRAGKTCQVNYSRSYSEGKSSTVCMPFAFKRGSKGTFYTFSGISMSGNEYVADMTEYTGDYLVPNTPYLFTPSATSVDFSGTYALPASITAGETTSGDWTYVGTYETIEWTTAPTGIYGFSAQDVSKQGISKGEFVKVGEYVRIKPMRCYLKYKNGGEDFAGARSAAPGEQLPETIKVRLIGADGEVTSIGSLQTTTGEATFDNDSWYTLDGRRIEGKPSTKGIYVRSTSGRFQGKNKGKMVIIK
ncbi:hypothetical protein [Xylanibacter brevis]|uniref:hypothetical protein n=1 Tax=Xylanibacter brevis TaxID=83231 RepID=UPI0012DF4564|nr:hypothetical protein [Xylanibacter brevis]